MMLGSRKKARVLWAAPWRKLKVITTLSKTSEIAGYTRLGYGEEEDDHQQIQKKHKTRIWKSNAFIRRRKLPSANTEKEKKKKKRWTFRVQTCWASAVALLKKFYIWLVFNDDMQQVGLPHHLHEAAAAAIWPPTTIMCNPHYWGIPILGYPA